MKITTKIDQLTSLRFFAAFMIVYHHAHDIFGISLNYALGLDGGVSFFFILSGFILTYVYPGFDSWRDVKKFFRARIARIYPAYLASFFLGTLLLSYSFELDTFVPFVLMFQAWIPLIKYYFSYNSVGWSVSTEFFFYLVFPLIVATHFKKYLVVLLSSMVVLATIFILADTSFVSPTINADKVFATKHGLQYINPLARIFEFIVGMGVALIWKQGLFSRINAFYATILEIIAIVYCVVSLHGGDFLVPLVESLFGELSNEWRGHCRAVIALAFLVYIFSQGKGLISRALAWKPFIFLGEVSYSIYLIHQIIIIKYASDFRVDLNNSNCLLNIASFIIYVALIIALSSLMWLFIEKPFRNILLGRFSLYNLKSRFFSSLDMTKYKIATAIITIAVVCVYNKTLWLYLK